MAQALKSFSAEGIVLNHYPTGRGNLFVHYYTAGSGKISALMRKTGKACSAFAGCGELLSLERIRVVPHKDYYILTGAEKISRIGFTDLSFFYSANLFAEIIGRDLPEPDQLIFSNFKNFLFETSQDDSLPRTLWFFALLLQELGWFPDFSSCAECRHELSEIAFFSLQSGGPVCESCARDTALLQAFQASSTELHSVFPQTLDLCSRVQKTDFYRDLFCLLLKHCLFQRSDNLNTAGTLFRHFGIQPDTA
ncbi:MAG: DNA repair protein RecO [Candidatus Wallbacteria bacterium]|nr:DNA repair protein RecO [Candidatus Wallbacteria bacterium]